MKSIADLNSKWWYRLVKVAFLGFEIVVLLAAVGSMTSDYGPHFDDTKSYVYCNNGSKFTGFLPKEVGVFVYSDYISTNDDQTFRELCNSVVTQNADGSLKVKRGTATAEKNYTFTAKYTSRDWVSTLLYSLGAIISVLLGFEIVRRVFYYILLGSVRPRKTTD